MNKDGVCEFCGQAVLEGSLCNCDQARKEQETLRIIREAHANIDDLFGAGEAAGEFNGDAGAVLLLKDAVELIANNKIKSVTVRITGAVSATVSTDSKGNIKTSRVFKRKDELTA